MKRVKNSVHLILLGLFCVLNLSSAAEWLHYPISNQSLIIPDQGKWSIGSEDRLFDLAGKWQVQSDNNDIPKEIVVPFAWNGWEGSVQLVKYFTLPDIKDEYNWKLVVDGAAISLNVILNELNLETRRGDDISFSIDIDPRVLQFGDDTNQIILSIDNSLDNIGNPPLRGSIFSRQLFGGLFRGIFLLGKPKVCVQEVSAKWKSAINSDGEAGSFEINAVFENDNRANHTEDIQQFSVVVSTMYGEKVAEIEKQSLLIPPGNLISKKITVPITNSLMWSTKAQSDIYKVKVTVESAEQSNSLTTLAGVRSLQLDDKDFTLNKRRIVIKCINYQGSDLIFGPFPSVELLELDMNLIKRSGANTVKLKIGQATPLLMEICDKIGLLVFLDLNVRQIPDPILGEENYVNSAIDQFEEIIKRYRRFTCLAAWGIGSEISLPNPRNSKFYTKMVSAAKGLDDRPVYVSTPFKQVFSASPLDFVILELTDYSEWSDRILPEEIHSDVPVLLGGVRRIVDPGNLLGWEVPFSESGQAKYIHERLKQAESKTWCKGVIVGDLLDWKGAVPLISGPFRGKNNFYTSGLLTKDRKPRLSYRRLKGYWNTGIIEPIFQGNYQQSSSSVLIIISLSLLFILLFYLKQNKIFKFNMIRSFISARGFFQDISDSRYFQNSHSLVLYALISCGIGLTGAGWLYASRTNYAVDWIVGYILGSSSLTNLAATFFWQPIRGFLLVSIFGFFLLLGGAIHSFLISTFYRQKNSVAQNIDLVMWAGSVMVGFIPLGLFAGRLYSTSNGWIVNIIASFLVICFFVRLVWAYKFFINKSMISILIMWLIPPLLLIITIFSGLEIYRSIFSYWDLIFGTIIN